MSFAGCELGSSHAEQCHSQSARISKVAARLVPSFEGFQSVVAYS